MWDLFKIIHFEGICLSGSTISINQGLKTENICYKIYFLQNLLYFCNNPDDQKGQKMTQNEIIGNNIKLFREKMGMTQEALAGYLDIPRELLSYYEGGKRNIPTETISKTSALFGVDEYDLYETEPEKQTAKLSFAFRADALTPEDLARMAEFKKIVLNYLGMKNLLMK